jgi:hypothetical protein
MPATLTENAANANLSAGLSVPSNGDDSVDWFPLLISAFQQLADRTQALHAGSLIGDGTTTKIISARLDAMINVDSRFGHFETSNHMYYTQTSVSSVGALMFPLDPLPPGATIESVSMRIKGGGHASLPTTMPTITLYEVEDQTDTQLVTATDTSANVAAYDAFHTVTAAVGATVDPLKCYHVKIEGEAGGTSAVGLVVAAIFVELGP